MFIIDILIFFIVLGIIVIIHEFGHFYFARKADILCHEFSIGMGPVIYQKRKDEVLYSIRAIPLGGYVAMAGEELKDAFIQEQQLIGIKTDDNNLVTEIFLDHNNEDVIVGRVKKYDLYGKDDQQLYIELIIDGELKTYFVNRDARYIFKDKKEMWITPAEKSFENKSLWQRFLVIFAGPVMNFILAFVLLFIVAIAQGAPSGENKIGKLNKEFTNINKGDVVTHVNGEKVNDWNDIVVEIYKSRDTKAYLTIDEEEKEIDLVVVLSSLGVTSAPGGTDIIIDSTFGRKKELKEGDLIKGIQMSSEELKKEDIKYTDVNDWKELINYVDEYGDNQYVYIRYERDGKVQEDHFIGISKKAIEDLGSSAIGYVVGFEQSRKFSFTYLFKYPIKKIGQDTKQIFNTFKLLFSPKEKIGVSDLSGPVGIFSLVSNAVSQGVISLMVFMAFLSINIGFLNLLPIPALDGGRIVFLIIEGITGKKVNKKVENIIITVTFFLLLGLIIFVTFNDILQLIG